MKLLETAALFVTLALLPAGIVRAQATDGDWPGIQQHRFVTKAGMVSVVLPDDIRAGDTVSGTVSVEPAGKTERERARNGDTLAGYVFDVGGTRQAASDKRLRFVAPAAGGAALAAALLLDEGGKPVGRSAIQIGSAPLSPQRPLPNFAQAGRPMTVPGTYDGDARNTNVNVNGRPVEVIAKSPRNAVFVAPDDPGPAKVAVREEGRPAIDFTTNVARVSLSAAKTNLMRGEKTTLGVQVSGLSGMRGAGAPQPRLVIEASPSVQLEGGNLQDMPVVADQAGTMAFNRQIVAVAPGGFQVMAQLAGAAGANAWPRDPLHPGALDMNGVDSILKLMGITAGMDAAAREALLRATLAALRTRLSQSTDPVTRNWLRNKIGIVEGMMDRLGLSH